MTRVQLLSHSYAPESTPPQRRWQRLSAALTEHGWQVEVVTPTADPRQTPSPHPAGGGLRLRGEAGPAGEQVLRVPRLCLPETRAGRLATDVVTAALMVPRALTTRRPDVVIATVPALPVICAGWLAARLRGVPLVVDMRDAWPELARDAGVRAGPAGRLMETVVTWVQREADLVVTVTEGFAQRLTQRGVRRVATISNGVDLAAVPHLDHRTREPGRLRVAYLGNHGESQALELVIDAVRRIHQAGAVQVELRLVGSGTQKDRLMALAGNCPAIEFHAAVHGPEVWEQYRWADTALVSLRTDWASFAWTVPSKTFELMGMGKHITGAVRGEAAQVLRQAENVTVLDLQAEGARDPVDTLTLAWTAMAEDPDSTPVSDTGRRWVAQHADFPGLGRRYSQLLTEVLPPGAGAQNNDHRARADRPAIRWEQVWICVCTYRRNDLLADLMNSLEELQGSQRPNVLIVDNDPDAGARATVRGHRLEAHYVHQPRPGIASARNAALDALPADADVVVFLDDDERVTPRWLVALIDAADASGADTVSGPVRSVYPPGVPQETIDLGAIRRTDFPTGPWSFRPATNNVLVRADWFTQVPAFRFDETFNFSGGEDSELFSRLQAAGARSWWCAEAEVFEDVPLERTTPQWLRQRGVRAGHVRTMKAVKRRRPRASIASEAVVRIGLGAGRVALRKARGGPASFHDRLWLREGIGMLQALTGRDRAEYQR